VAVVEDVTEWRSERRVLLFTRPSSPFDTAAPSIYTPPSRPFQPSDVLFFTHAQAEVLLVADEVGDVIHVLRVQAKGHELLGMVGMTCPLLTQPTALCHDLDPRRVWVACRARRVLCLTPRLDAILRTKVGLRCHVM
jgi:hypothetical protein